MRYTNFFFGVLTIFLALMTSASAAPMGFKNSWMVMGDTSKNFQELAFNYATTANDAFGLSVSGMESHHSMKQQNVEAVYTRKVARWNMPNAQANIWFIGGIGSTTGNTFEGSRLTTSPGVQLDYETTRVYVMALHGFIPAKVRPAASTPSGWEDHFMKFTMTSPSLGSLSRQGE